MKNKKHSHKYVKALGLTLFLGGLVGILVAGYLALDLRSVLPRTELSERTQEEAPELLFVQYADGGRFVKEGDDVSLVLRGVSPRTIAFSNRPHRLVAPQGTATFVGAWAEGQESFMEDPPNASIVTHTDDGDTIAAVVELLDPSYDETTRVLTYRVVKLAGESVSSLSDEGMTMESLPDAFGSASIFIDGVHSKERFHVKNKTNHSVKWVASWGKDFKIGAKYKGIGVGYDGSVVAVCTTHPGKSCNLHTMSACYDINVFDHEDKLIARDTTECVNLVNTPVLLDFKSGSIRPYPPE